MNLVRFHHPHYNVNQNLVNELFNNFLRNDYHEKYLKSSGNKPATNVFETENNFKLELLLPGFKKEDVQLNAHENVLTVKVELTETEDKKEEQYKYERREFGAYNFERKFRIPKSVDAEKINAHFENGILELVLPKKEEAVDKGPVEIKVG